MKNQCGIKTVSYALKLSWTQPNHSLNVLFRSMKDNNIYIKKKYIYIFNLYQANFRVRM